MFDYALKFRIFVLSPSLLFFKLVTIYTWNGRFWVIWVKNLRGIMNRFCVFLVQCITTWQPPEDVVC
jgi:hypothetical protein